MLTAQRLREVLDYDPATGIFRWREQVKHPRKGKVAGSPTEWGHLRIKIDDRLYAAHRLVWLYVYGHFPDAELDHINRMGSDNRIDNLRLATDDEQSCNKGTYKNNRAGIKGVRLRNGKWEARIQRRGVPVYLGQFHTIEEATAAYKAAAAAMHGEFAYGNTSRF